MALEFTTLRRHRKYINEGASFDVYALLGLSRDPPSPWARAFHFRNAHSIAIPIGSSNVVCSIRTFQVCVPCESGSNLKLRVRSLGIYPSFALRPTFSSSSDRVSIEDGDFCESASPHPECCILRREPTGSVFLELNRALVSYSPINEDENDSRAARKAGAK